jgi:2-phospho-L-lactate guanylyltransferase
MAKKHKSFMRPVNIIIPFKFENAKSRLASILTKEERQQLALAMLKDVLDVTSGVGPVTILSKPGLLNLKLNIYANVIESELELNEALNWMIDGSCKRGFHEDLLIVMADLALLSNEDIMGILKTEGDVVLTPGRGGGTNMILIRNPKFRTCYYGISYPKHQEFCIKLGLLSGIYASYRSGCDIDEPDDLNEILIHGHGFCKDLLKSFGFRLSDKVRTTCNRSSNSSND